MAAQKHRIKSNKKQTVNLKLPASSNPIAAEAVKHQICINHSVAAANWQIIKFEAVVVEVEP